MRALTRYDSFESKRQAWVYARLYRSIGPLVEIEMKNDDFLYTQDQDRNSVFIFPWEAILFGVEVVKVGVRGLIIGMRRRLGV
jgi:hypothetical protein